MPVVSKNFFVIVWVDSRGAKGASFVVQICVVDRSDMIGRKSYFPQRAVGCGGERRLPFVALFCIHFRILEGIIMDAGWSTVVVVSSVHVPFVCTLIHDEQDLGGNLSTEKCSLFIAKLLPFGEIFRNLDRLDATWCLPMGRVCVVTVVRGEGR